MPLPASIFRPAPAHCPSCHRPLPGLGDECALCHYTAWDCVERFPYEPPPLERIMDPELRLGIDDLAKLQRQLDEFEKTFPQVRIFCCITRLPAGADACEFGFWLFNRSIPRTATEQEQRIHGMLLVVDRGNRKASLTLGYGLDPFLSDKRLSEVLAPCRNELHEGAYGPALEKLFTRLRALLTIAHREAASIAAKYHAMGDHESPQSQRAIRQFASEVRKEEY